MIPQPQHLHAYPTTSITALTMVRQGNTADLLGIALSPHSHQCWSSLVHPDHPCTLKLAPLNAFLDQILTDLVDRAVSRTSIAQLTLDGRPIHFTVRPSHRAIAIAQPPPRHASRNLSALGAPPHALLFLLESKSLRESSCTTLRDDGRLPADIIPVFDVLLPGTFWELEELSLDMEYFSDEFSDCLTRSTPHITTLSLDVREMAWGPTPGSYG